jgi:hypothetical protein
MEMFLGSQISPDDPRKVQVYRNFQSNLADILRAGRNSGANLILNTVAVNLKDCPPLAVLATSNRPAGDLTEFNRLIAEAGQRQVQGDYGAAGRTSSGPAFSLGGMPAATQ